MKYFPYNEKTEADLQQIKRLILLSMNGITAENMETAGIFYKQNFGVALPRIKEIAGKYPQNQLLAEHLWHSNIREMMIMATIIFPPALFSEKIFEEWLKDIQTTELCRQFSFNLFCKTTYAEKKIRLLLDSESIYYQIIALLTASRIIPEISQESREKIIEYCLQKAPEATLELYHAIAVCLRYISRISFEVAKNILSKISTFEKSGFTSCKYIFEEVKQEIAYRYG
jgi:3-methyladenine DNA glycosylase AlkD